MIVIYIFDHLWNKITQIDNGIKNFECKLKLNDISECYFSVSNTHRDNFYSNFKEFNKIKITESKLWVEKIIIEWIIKKVTSNLTETKVLINSDLYLFKRKKLNSDLTFNNTKITDIISQILPSWYSLNSKIEDSISKEYKRWSSSFDVLKDISLSWYEFKIENNILYFAKEVWKDRSLVWDDFVDFVFNYKNIRENTISEAKLEYDAEKITNKITWKNWNKYVTKENEESIQSFWKVEDYFTASWDLESATREHLEEHKNSVREFEISPLTRDFFVADIWDTVKVFIDAGNDIMYFDWTLKVIEKTFKIDELPKITIKLAKTKVKSNDIIDTLKSLKEEMKYFRITN